MGYFVAPEVVTEAVEEGDVAGVGVGEDELVPDDDIDDEAVEADQVAEQEELLAHNVDLPEVDEDDDWIS